MRDFVELFDVGLENTRVGLIQYSDQIRHEFDLNQYSDKPSLLQAITQTQYLTGLTRLGSDWSGFRRTRIRTIKK